MRFRVVLIEQLPWIWTDPITGGTAYAEHPSSWFWRLQSAGNHKTLAHSEMYSSKQAALKTAGALAAALGIEVESEDG